LRIFHNYSYFNEDYNNIEKLENVISE